MKIDSSKNYSTKGDEIDPERLVARWLEVTSTFHRSYNEVVRCISQTRNQPGLTEVIYIGQCPVDQLRNLVFTMQAELKKMLQDMSQVNSRIQPSSQKDYKKLANHTRILAHLNQQARRSLQLTTRSVS